MLTDRHAPTSLTELGRARDALLERITEVLREDARVGAAWLSGSFGRGEADDFSDLDLHVAVADADLPAVRAQPRALFERCGHVILVQAGFPSNSMPDGHFWLVLYRWAIEVDWNIGPVGRAFRPAASHVLFDRVGIPIAPPPPPVPDEDRVARAATTLAFFWAMAPIALKYTGRGHTRRAVEQIGLLTDAFVTLWRAACQPLRLSGDRYEQNRPLEPELDERLPRVGHIITPLETLRVIRALCGEVERLHPTLAALGVAIPAEMPGEVAALAALVAPLAQRGGTQPEAGSRR